MNLREYIKRNIEITYAPTGKREPNVDCVPLLFEEPEFDDSDATLFDFVFELRRSGKLDVICGIPLGGALLAYHAANVFAFNQCPMCVIDERRTVRRIRGHRPKLEEHVVIFDDVCGTGTTIANTAEIIRSLGATVSNAVVLVDRGIGGSTKLEKRGITLHSCVNLKEDL